MPRLRPFLHALLALTLVLAHQEPKTEREIQVQKALQAAAYHCAPAVAEFTAARQRSWAQQVLGGNPHLPAYDDLFAEGTYQERIAAKDSTYLECSPVEETRIENNTCVLTPVVTEGPYYHTAGHPIRRNIAEYQIGLLTLLDIGVIDVNTCKPLPNVLVDIWHANATGHYAGHPFPKPELVNEKPQVGGKRSGLLSAFPRTVYEESWLRGAWPTDRNGVAQFTTIFPGYYTGRATHVHTKVFTSWEPLPNGTFDAGNLAHVGQFFFEDNVNLQVDKACTFFLSPLPVLTSRNQMHPYTDNPIRHTYGRTRNWRDSLNIFEDSLGPEGQYYPVFKTHLLGGILNQGVIAYITMGINASASYDNWWKG
ncbi:hypothetical protein E1B28_006010 [Marasmius oreades]|uniref:Aromatic compound dioxygenase n=1 Tax=Marasmius oreades TaxID=181124 RepID=A0A9P7UVZ8_9AGAR|nr:uncharacterized protein E1B28_006010 [Marasmius oreades]KAG7095236.1 hypothetical protein E1B28_006010 [Marasmius oreades]